MKIDKYLLKSECSFIIFEFISEGPKGNIHKVIHFQKTNQPRVFNLAFGDKNLDTGDIDDLAISNNNDGEKVLATVVSAVYAFFEKHPDSFVYATGSTKSRTRLYRMGITKYYGEMVADFYLYGRTDDGFQEFELNKDYIGFLAQRKFN
ncbi:DUF6934 family protein [Pinibacter aurantiacus]|uniref:Uncharacterized protein n=1 Tax=Pinibacter aurantiacus TaxID=2851599 RepID=A0A9E2W3I9_9BACT|nr:hypothetical protein [Pinibacter aurantiacus]MBV4358590.1 hypothetical protein [Pinibacter aurantiacus]